MSIFGNTYQTSNTQSQGVNDIQSALRAGLHQLAVRWIEWRTRDQEMRELHRFSDRELWDVGLSRSDIMSIENGTFRRD
jgi:uncharacterized protein YjiS (DUF1127 family)